MEHLTLLLAVTLLIGWLGNDVERMVLVGLVNNLARDAWRQILFSFSIFAY